MQSDIKDVARYVENVPEHRRVCLAELRRLCRQTLPDYTEDMTYGMPSYSKDGVVAVAFASRKNYISLYILKQDVIQANRALLDGLSVGKGCIRYTKPERVKFEVVKKLLEGTRESNLDSCAPIAPAVTP